MNKFEIRESDLHIRGYGNVPVADVSPFRIYVNRKIPKGSKGNSYRELLSFHNPCEEIMQKGFSLEELSSEWDIILCGISTHIVDDLLNEITATAEETEEIREDTYLFLDREGDNDNLIPLTSEGLWLNKPTCTLQDYTKTEVSLEEVKLAPARFTLPICFSVNDNIWLTIERYHHTSCSLAHHIYVVLHGLMVRRREIITETKKNENNPRDSEKHLRYSD